MGAAAGLVELPATGWGISEGAELEARASNRGAGGSCREASAGTSASSGPA